MRTKFIFSLTILTFIASITKISASATSEESWDAAIQRVRTNCLSEIKAVDLNLAKKGIAILESIHEASLYAQDDVMRAQVKASHITRDLSERHISWLHRLKELRVDEEKYAKIQGAVQRTEALINRFYIVFLEVQPQSLMQETSRKGLQSKL